MPPGSVCELRERAAAVDPVAAASVADNVSDAYRHVGPHLPELLAHDRDAAVVVVASLTPRQDFTASVPLYTGLIARASAPAT